MHLASNVLGEFLALSLKHFTAHRAEVKQGEDVDFEDLVVGQLFHGFLEFSLLARQVSPERVPHLGYEVFNDKFFTFFIFFLSHL